MHSADESSPFAVNRRVSEIGRAAKRHSRWSSHNWPAGINTLAVDSRAHGESGGTGKEVNEKTSADMETLF